MDQYADKVDEGIVPEVDRDLDSGEEDELHYEDNPGDHQQQAPEDDQPPVVPPPLIEDLDPPPQPVPYHNHLRQPGYPDDDNADRSLPTSGESPSLPTTPSPNATKRMPSYRKTPTQSPERHPTLTRNRSPDARDQSTLPRDHASPSHDQVLGDMEDKLSAKNTITSYRTDRTARTVDPELRIKAKKIYRSALTHLVCGLYALILIVIGLVFSLSTSLTRHIGEGSLYLQVFLLYVYGMSLFFLAYLHCCLLGRRKSRDDASFHHINLVSNNHLENEKCSVDYNPDLDMTSSMSKEKRSRSRSHSDFEEAMDGLNNDFDSITFDAEDINFYLRLGAISKSPFIY